MSNTLYDLSVPMFIHNMEMLIKILGKGENYAVKKKLDPKLLVDSRLIVDMYSIPRQIQIATDMVRKGIGRLAGKDVPSFKDNEQTFQQLQKRLERTINFLKKIKPKDMEGAETKKIEFLIRDRQFKFDRGDEYLTQWIIPHFFFHMTTTYNILRANGVNLGKRDFVKM
jgi:hypothetical protein